MIFGAVRGAVLPLAAALSAALILPVASGADAQALPNLRARAPLGLYIETDDEGARPAVRFATDVANDGEAPFEIQPVLEPDRIGSFRQCSSWTAGVCDGFSDPVSDALILEPGTRCWRIAGLLRFELRMLEPDGTPVASDAGLVGVGGPASHWLEDERRNADAAGSDVPSYPVCSVARMGLSSGWVSLVDGDEHGQWIGLEGVPDGSYALVSIVDPLDVVRETTDEDNSAWAAIEITDGGTRVEVVGP